MNLWFACSGKPTIPLTYKDVRKRSTATETGTESQITQHVRGYVSPMLFLSFSKPTSLEPTLHCSPCSPARASLQYETISPTWWGPATGAAFRKAARLTRSQRIGRG